MQQAIINLSFKQYINPNTTDPFERAVIEASYKEFVERSVAYNPDFEFRTFSEMVDNDGKANSLHYKCGQAITQHIDDLKGRIPVLADNAGNHIKFVNRQFHILESDITDITKHRVAITYLTDLMTLVDNIGEYLVLAYGNKAESLLNWEGGLIDTFLLKMAPGLSVCNYSAVTMVLQKLS